MESKTVLQSMMSGLYKYTLAGKQIKANFNRITHNEFETSYIEGPREHIMRLSKNNETYDVKFTLNDNGYIKEVEVA